MSDRFPWFPLYTADWLTSHSVRAMTLEQQGLYLRLLALAWDGGDGEPCLPADPAILARVAGVPPTQWRKIAAPILACFTERDGQLYNAKLSHVWSVQSAKYALRQAAGKAGAEAKAKRKQTSSNAGSNAGSNASANGHQNVSTQTQSQTELKSSSGAPMRALVDSALGAATRRRR